MDALIEACGQQDGPGALSLIAAWGMNFPWLKELSNTPQDREWHAEGDVQRHTQMVMQALEALLAEGAWTASERRCLRLAALFHDIAKPVTTRTAEIDGVTRVIAPRHAERGRSYLAYRLPSLGLPFAETHQVLQLVGLHHAPKRLVLRDRGRGAYLRLASQIAPKMLYTLAMADMRGRHCRDASQQIEIIEMFRLFCEEYGVWETPEALIMWRDTICELMPNASLEAREFVAVQGLADLEAGLIHSSEEAVARHFSARECLPTVTVMCGPSGSGKSRWCAIQRAQGTKIVSLDLIRESLTGKRDDQSRNREVVLRGRELLRVALRERSNVIWDATSLRRDFRAQVFTLAHNYKARCDLVVVSGAEEDILVQNRARTHAVPTQVLRRQLSTLEWPEQTEAHRTQIIDTRGSLIHDTRQFWANETPTLSSIA